MSIKTACITFTAVFAFAGIAGAWGLPAAISSVTSPSADPDAFLAKAQKSEALINKSSDSIFGVVASNEDLAKMDVMQKKINETADDKEKNAMRQQMAESKMALIAKQAADEKIQKQVKELDVKKKAQISDAFYNFSLGALQAGLLVPEGTNIAKSISSNPVNAARLALKLNSVYDSVKSIGGILGNTTKVISAMRPLMAAANIEAKVASTATEKPSVVAEGI